MIAKLGRRKIFTLLAASALWPLTPSLPRAADEPQRFTLDLHDGQVLKEQQTLRVHQGDAVELRWTTDRPARLHLHGYDIQLAVNPGEPAVMAFTARAAGRFSVAAIRDEPAGRASHQHGAAILYLEVYP